MSRPKIGKDEIVIYDAHRNTWHCRKQKEFYILTFDGELVSVHMKKGIKFPQLAPMNRMLLAEVSIKTLVKRYNKLFMTDKFGYTKITL